jgi:ATP-dependent exoDNAse (exonuclease V) alpha subunit
MTGSWRRSMRQELLAARGRLGFERLQVEDRQLAVGDRVVCGHNAIAELGVANGSRGTITALDAQTRTLTIRLDGTDGQEVILPRSYLDGRGQQERNRRVDLAYATTGHRAQGLTRGRALVRLTGREDVNWLYVQLSRARQDTRLYAVVGPEPQGAGELDLPDRDQPDGYLQLAQALSRAGARPGHRYPHQPRSPATVDGRAAGPAGPAAPPARPGPPGIAAGSWPGP